jgi:hypothetical protein
MRKPVVQWSTVPNSVTAVSQLVRIMCTLYFQDLTQREVELLCEILNVGELTKEAKKSFMLNYNTSVQVTENLIFRLTQKGILVQKDNLYKYRTGKQLHSIFDTLKSILNGEADSKIILNFDDGQKKK